MKSPLCLVMYLAKGRKCNMKTIMVGRTPLGTRIIPFQIFATKIMQIFS
jgi:hypothetical protein